MPTHTRKWITGTAITIADAVVFAIAFWVALIIRYGTAFPPREAAWGIFAAPIIGIACLAPFRFYREVIRFVGPNIVHRGVAGVSLATICLLAMSFLRGQEIWVSRLVFLPFWMGSLIGVIGIRYVGRMLMQRRRVPGGRPAEPRRVMIYGAGEAGVGLLSMLGQDASIEVECFVDDDARLAGRWVRGVPVFAPQRLEELIRRFGINTVMLALPSASRPRRRQVIQSLANKRVQVLTVPDMQELDSGSARYTDLRPIDLADLLGRESIEPNRELLRSRIRGRVVLVTGAGGSIGSELCRQIVRQAPARLIIVDNCEFNLYQIDSELRSERGDGVAIVTALGDACDLLQMRNLMAKHGADTVYHAAAYKHVPIVEENAIVGVRNNVFGTLRTAEAAIESGVKDFVLVSTDKAVRPTSVMGASKRLAELVLQGFNERFPQVNFCMVRFGNVLGSSGSAVPKFQEQIRAGGPVTVTHPEVTRFFMTTSEAANLVIQAGALAEGGDVFVLDMGEPVRIADLARRMIELSGARVRDDENPLGDIAIEFTGLRPGEKLYEELLIDGVLERTMHPKILKSAEHFIPWSTLSKILQRLEAAIDRRDEATVLEILRETVLEYRGPSAPVSVTD